MAWNKNLSSFPLGFNTFCVFISSWIWWNFWAELPLYSYTFVYSLKKFNLNLCKALFALWGFLYSWLNMPSEGFESFPIALAFWFKSCCLGKSWDWTPWTIVRLLAIFVIVFSKSFTIIWTKFRGTKSRDFLE